METNTRHLLYAYIKEKSGISAHKLHEHFDISKEMIHRHLKKLIQEGKIYKEGSPPKVLYYAMGGLELEWQVKKGHYYFTLLHKGKVLTITHTGISKQILQKENLLELVDTVTSYLDKEYVAQSKKIKPNILYNELSYQLVTTDSSLLMRFENYIQKQFPHMMEERIKRIYGVFLMMHQSLAEGEFLDASLKFVSLKPEYRLCKEKVHLESLYYSGLDKIDHHKSDRYTTMESIKSFQNPNEIETFYDTIFSKTFDVLLDELSIDAILVIPNSVGRNISFNEYIQTQLMKRYQDISFLFTKTNIFPGRREQKKISGICNRIENAEKLFTITSDLEGVSYKNILLIDDVLGSGATMNTVAKKVKHLMPNATLHGYAILGSFRKGFDVVSGI